MNSFYVLRSGKISKISWHDEIMNVEMKYGITYAYYNVKFKTFFELQEANRHEEDMDIKFNELISGRFKFEEITI